MGSTKYPPIPPLTGGRPGLPGTGQPAPMQPGEFVGGSIANVTKFKFDLIDPPSPLYLQRDDVLLFTFTSQSPSVQVVINGRFLRVPEPTGGQPSEGGVGKSPGGIFEHGIVEPLLATFTTPAGSAIGTGTLQLAEGYLLSLSATSGNAFDRGQLFVRAQLLRQPALTGNVTLTLFADYCGSNIPISWPYGRVLSTVEGPGFVHTIQQGNPAAGADWVYTLTGKQKLRIITLQAQLAVANSGAARPVEFIVDDGVNIVARMSTNTAAPINATANINFSNAGTPSTSIVSDLYAQMPATLVLNPGHRIRTVTTNIVAGDQWSNIWFLAEEWLTLV